ncbi:putative NAD dependent epimerase/dehydratase [Xylaria intraflava]|nr:putative NAD dependent epimerase/dehydratase [Xylaria intraflava]
MSPTIFVCAATGTLGKAVALSLIEIGWGVHAITRDLASPAAKELISVGVKLTQGDWDNKKILHDTVAGCDGLFLNLLPTHLDLFAEARQGKNVIEVAKAAGVKHIIYAAGAKITIEDSDLVGKTTYAQTLLQNKLELEEVVRDAGFEAYTILRPPAFMANWLAPKLEFQAAGIVENGTFDTALRPDTVITAMDEQDFAAFTVAAFKDPARFHAQAISVVSDVITVEEILKLLSDATGRQLRAHYMSDEEVSAKLKGNPMLEGQVLTRRISKYFNIDDTRKWGLPLHTFKEYLEREKDRVKETYNRS